MDTNTNDYILVLEDKESKKLSVVSSVDAEGKVQTVEPLDAHSGQFMKFIENDSIFKNFMENFTRQFNDPSKTGLYRLVADKVESSVMILQEMLQQPQENEEQLKLMRVNLEDYAPKEQLGRVNEERIDWNELTAIGISREQLKASGNLEKMLGWGKSNLMAIAVPFGDKTIYTEARLAFGRLADVTPKNGEPFKAFISVDQQTNELIALRADRVRVPDEIKGVKLSEQQKTDLAMCKAVAVENMISKAGKPFNAQIQINADKKGIEFKFDNTPRQSVTQHVNQEQQKGVSRKICGVELTEKQQAALNEGRTLYIKNMVDRAGQPFNAYVKFDKEENRPRFYRWNPDRKQEQGEAKVVAVAEENKTQVAVNNEGKTNEATKHVKEPLKKEQIEPTEKQKKEVQKKKGRKI